MDLFELMAHLTIDTSQFEAGLARAEAAANRAATNIRSIMSSIGSMGSSFTAAGSAASASSSSVASSIQYITRNVYNGATTINNYRNTTTEATTKAAESWSNLSNTVSKAMKAVGVAISAASVGIGKLVKDSVSAYAEYEQLVGGVETIFKNASDTVLKNAQNAYKTAQISTNAYLQQVISFSATLLQSIAKTDSQINKMTEEEYAESLENQLEKQEEMLDEQYEAAKKSYDKSYDALSKALSDEIEAYQDAMDKKIDQINKEYTERIKLIDEERYNRIKAIDDQIDALNEQADAESYLTDKQAYETKKAELEDTAANARKRKVREAAKQELDELEAYWNKKESDRARKQQIDSLKDEKEAIKDEYDAKKEALKEEQDAAVSAVKGSEKAQLKALKEAKQEQLEAVKEANQEQLKVLKKRYDEELKLAQKAAKEQLAAFGENSIGEYTEEQYLKAAEVSNRIMTNMADNAMKLGTPLYMIQNAYRGLLIENYRMLDNLHIGYGQTKAEAQRLVKDASQMTDIQKKLGVSVDGTSLSFENLVNAISVVQDKLGFTGVAEWEATNTIQGSVQSMKAAWSNLIAGMSGSNADVEDLMNKFVDTVVGSTDEAGNQIKGALQNILPAIEQALLSIGDIIGKIVPIIISRLPDLAKEIIPSLIATAVKLVSEVVKVIPEISKSLVEAVLKIFDVLGEEIPNAAGIFKGLRQLFEKAFSLVESVVSTIQSKLAPVFQKLAPVIEKIVNLFADVIAKIADSKLIMGSFSDIVGVVATVLNTLIAALSGILDYFSQNDTMLMGLIGSFIALAGAVKAYNIVMGIAKGAVEAWNLVTKAATAVQAGLNAAMAANPIGLVIVAIGALVAAITLLWNNCEEFRNAIIYMYNEWQHGIELIGEWFFNVGQEIKAFWEGIPKFFEDVWHGIQDAFAGVAAWFTKVFSDAWEGIKNVFSATGEMFGNIGKSILNGISSVINGIIWGINQVIKIPFDGLNGILRLIHDIDIMGLKPFSWIGQIQVPQIPSIPMLAEGGVLKKGQIALLEGQGDEAVIPLSKNTEWIDKVADRLNEKSQSINYTINVEVANMNANSRDDIEKLAETLMQVMSEKTMRRGAAFR